MLRVCSGRSFRSPSFATRRLLAVAAVVCAGSWARAGGGGGQRADTVPVLPAQDVSPAAGGNVATPASGNAPIDLQRAQAEAQTVRMMEAWHAKHPDRYWERTPAHAAKPSPLPGSQQQQTYGAFSERDEQIWEASLESFVHRGKAVFHDAQTLGSTTAISCDMCHPDAANTHPETYPKFQVQLGRVAHLRDMINWCLQNPVRAKPMADDDDRLKAMEGYILYQRGGVPLSPGKH